MWRPRGVSVVEDYSKLVTMERRAADVQAIRVILAASPNAGRVQQQDAEVWATESRSEALLGKALALWQKRFGHVGEVSRPCIARFCVDEEGGANAIVPGRLSSVRNPLNRTF